jgi:uncharacterized protein YbjT (DUF2867 family)
MNNKQLVLVTGATGAQGGSVARALLEDGKFAVRVLTRNAKSEKALALQRAGAEVVEGNMEDIESLLQAMKDCYAVFGVTSFWEHFEKEYDHGKNLINAAHQSGIKHFILHTLPDYNKLSGGKFPVPHYDLKAALQEYTVSLGIPATFVHMGFYYENFLGFFPLHPNGDGSFWFGFPQGDARLAATSVEDTGGVIATILDHPDMYIGRTVYVVGADDTCEQYAAAMRKVLGRNIQYKYIPRDEYAAQGFPCAEECANMFEVQRLYVPNRQLGLIESYGLNPSMQTFEAWVKRNKKKFDSKYFAPVLQEATA